MSTIALNNQNVYVNNKAEEKGRKENVCMGQKSEHLLWKMQMH
mgnify:CR=1 FL=1